MNIRPPFPPVIRTQPPIILDWVPLPLLALKCSDAAAIRYIFRNIASLPLQLQQKCSGATTELLLIYKAIFIKVNIECVNYDVTMQFDLFQGNAS